MIVVNWTQTYLVSTEYPMAPVIVDILVKMLYIILFIVQNKRKHT